MRNPILAALVCCACVAGSSVQGEIVVDQTMIIASIQGAQENEFDSQFSSQPSGSVVASLQSWFANSTVNTTIAQGTATIATDVAVQYPRVLNGYALGTFVATIHPSTSVAYEFSGGFTSPEGYTQLTVYLYDNNTSQYLFSAEQVSFVDSPMAYALGAITVPGQDIVAGSLTGFLLPGHAYSLTVDYLSASFDVGSPPDSIGSAHVVLTLAPEPSSIALAGAGLFGLTVARRRRRPTPPFSSFERSNACDTPTQMARRTPGPLKLARSG